MPKVSILVPVYNVESYLNNCLDSLIYQTMRDIEIICINDGSTDGSFEILKQYSEKDKRIIVIDKGNSGYGASMNIGLDKATGEYIGIVEPDDFANTKMFENLYKLAIKNDAEIIKSDYLFYTTKNNQSRKAGKINIFEANKVTDARKSKKLLKMAPSIWSAIYKREFLTKNNIRFLETAGASYQDTSFSFKALTLAKRIVLTDKAYLNYRQDNENSSVKSKAKVDLICKEYDEITDFLNKNPQIKEYANIQKLIKQYAGYMWNLKRIDEQFRPEFIEIFAETFKKYYEADEITNEFYKKVKKSEFELLLSDKIAFFNYINEVVEKENSNNKRRKLFSVRINFSRVSIILFGKQIVEIG